MTSSLLSFSARTVLAATLLVGWHPSPVQAAEDPAAALRGDRLGPGGVWLESIDDLPLSRRKSQKGTPIRIAGVEYPHGVGGGGRTELLLKLGRGARRFVSVVGVDDCERSNGSLRFEIWLDGRKVRDTGRMLKGESRLLSVDVTGADEFALVVDHGGESTDWERFGLGGAHFVLAEGAKPPRVFRLEPEEAPPIAPAVPADAGAPSINGPAVVGGTPGRPFLYRVPATGQGPLAFSAQGLPKGLVIDTATGIITGALAAEGRTATTITVKGARGTTRRQLTIVGARDHAVAALTPPMGWNSWNVWGMEVDGAKIRAAADALVSTGLAAHGYRYVNIDDGWMGTRGPDGVLRPNERFGGIKALADYVHAKGLKIGIYSSPGPRTCGKLPASHGHEELDAKTWASWGIDLLKYDWCSYDEIVKDWSLAEVQKPYRVMRAALDAAGRDVVYSLCQYGRGDVWTWGAEIGGNLWRTTSDISDSWPSLGGIGFAHVGKEPFARPGHWNDADMLVVGELGWGARTRPTHLSKNEQILHLTHWAMIASPLLIGADLTKLDAFTLALLTNDEVLAVNQDALGKAAGRRLERDRTEVWSRPLADGTQAVALYNRGPVRARVAIPFGMLDLVGKQPVRDLWQRRDLGTLAGEIAFDVPQHGAVMLKVGRPVQRQRP